MTEMKFRKGKQPWLLMCWMRDPAAGGPQGGRVCEPLVPAPRMLAEGPRALQALGLSQQLPGALLGASRAGGALGSEEALAR